jgi:hypothetical protein
MAVREQAYAWFEPKKLIKIAHTGGVWGYRQFL